MNHEEKLKLFAEVLESAQIKHLKDNHLDCQANINNAHVSIKPGNKYTKIDVGNSGKYMVENSTGNIFGIKAYGVIHRGHQYGTLNTINDWNWEEYTAIPKR
jgi:hypothetical protein